MNGARPKEPVSTEDLFRAHAPFVARFLTRLGVWPDELDDAVQEVFLVVHRNGGYVPGPATPTGYLASIAVRAAATYRRRGRKSRNRRSDLAPDDVSSTGLDPARSLEVRQALAELQGALDGLDPDLRATLVLAELEGESCLSIATTMRIAVGTVYWRLHHARKTFRQAIERRRIAEANAEGVAAGALLFGRTAEDLLEAGRVHPALPFDMASALARFRAAIGAGVSIPPWAVEATRAGVASGVGMTAPAVLSALVAVHAAGIGVSRWGSEKMTSRRPAPAALLASIGPELPREPVAGEPRSLVGLPTPSLAVRAVGNGDGVREAPAPAPGQPAAAAPHTPASSLAPPRSPWRSPLGPPAVDDSRAPSDPQSPDAMREVQEVASAQRLLSSDPAQALALVRSGEARFASGYLHEERRYVGIAALFKLGRLDEARAEAARFLGDYPDGPFTVRVRALR